MKKEKIPVSVVIPTYNRSTLLNRALASVFSQTVSCEEIIIVDDGSTDGTLERLSRLSQDYLDIELHIFTQENMGPAAARNQGIRQSRCSMIAFLDSDDHWQRKKLQVQYAMMKDRPEFPISHTYERWFRNGRHLNQKKRHIPRHGDIFSHCLELCAVGMSTVMLRKSLFAEVGLFDESMRCCEDYDFWLRVSCRYPFLLVETPLTVKEGGREDQVSSQHRTGMDRFRIDSLSRLLNCGTLSDCQREEARRELIRKCSVYGTGCLKHGKIEEGQRCLTLAKNLEHTSF